MVYIGGKHIFKLKWVLKSFYSESVGDKLFVSGTTLYPSDRA